MASIRKIEGKNGVSYKITVLAGKDAEGKQIRHYKTWKPDPEKTARQNERDLQRAAVEFERSIEIGFHADNRQTFRDYAEYFIGLLERQGLAPTTIEIRRVQARRCDPFIGHMRLTDIKPSHINHIYEELLKPGAWIKGRSAVPKADKIKQIAKERGLTRKKLAELCGVSENITASSYKGIPVYEEYAALVAEGLGLKLKDLYEVQDRPALSTSVVKGVHGFLVRLFNQAEKEMLVPFNPATRATPPKVKYKDPKYFQPEKLQEILEAAETEHIKYHTMIKLLAVSGIRRGELVALTWDKVDFVNGTILIDRSLSYVNNKVIEGPTKTHNTRYINLPAEMMRLLERYHSWWASQKLLFGSEWCQYLFPTWTGAPMNPTDLTDILDTFCKHHGFEHFNPHSLRHTFASILIGNGVDVVTVSKLLGHSKPTTTTDTYSHILEEKKQKAAECAGEIILRKKQA